VPSTSARNFAADISSRFAYSTFAIRAGRRLRSCWCRRRAVACATRGRY
jgi:hypothetical protein